MLCRLCKRASKLTGSDTTPLQGSLESLQLSAQDGCRICYLLWNTMETQQIDIDFGPGQDPSELCSPSRLPKYAQNYYGIRARCDVSYLYIECRTRQGYASLLDFDITSGTYDYDGQYSDGNSTTATTAASEHSFHLAQRWLKDCTTWHDECGTDIQPRVAHSLPTRLVQVQPQLRLVEGNSLPKGTRYIALSHCWGSKPIFTLRQCTLNDLFENIPAAELPKNFRDAIQFSRQLKVDYIWIDSLCIIQDSQEDWLRESVTMKDVYSNCWCNLAVTGFPNGENGLFFQRNPSLLFKPIKIPGGRPRTGYYSGYEKEKDYFLFDITHWYNGVEMAPLNQRAWVFQERLLSPRTIHFGTLQLFWECRKKALSETFPRNMKSTMKLFNKQSSVGLKEHFRERNISFIDQARHWFSIVNQYNKLQLTKEQDRLAAISGIAQELRHKMHLEYIAGLWKTDDACYLRWQLCWKVKNDEVSYRRSVYCAPSWSWASITGTIVLEYEWYSFGGDGGMEVLDTGIQPLGSDPTGALQSAYLRVRGTLQIAYIQLEPGVLRWRNRREESWPIEWYGSVIGYVIKINDTLLWGDGQVDACLTDSAIADIGAGPFDLSSTPIPKQPESMETTSSSSIEVYLLKVCGDRNTVKCLWLRPTGRVENEFQRIGFVEVKVDFCDAFREAESTVTVI